MTKRVKFSPSDDELLSKLVETYGTHSWNIIADHFQDRSPRQCRDRWKHYLAPTTKTDQWTPEGDRLLVQKVREYGKKWSQMAPFFAGRTATSIRNRCCKLSRQRHADPILKVILSGNDLVENPAPLNVPAETNQVKLPSISSLLELVNDKSMEVMSMDTTI